MSTRDLRLLSSDDLDWLVDSGMLAAVGLELVSGYCLECLALTSVDSAGYCLACAKCDCIGCRSINLHTGQSAVCVAHPMKGGAK